MLLTQAMDSHPMNRQSSSTTPLTSPSITPTLSPTTSLHSSPHSSQPHSLTSSPHQLPHSSSQPSTPVPPHELFSSTSSSRTSSTPASPSPSLHSHHPILSYPSSLPSRPRSKQFPPRKPPPPGSVAVGSSVLMRQAEFIHPSLTKYAGSEATIIGLPSHPITWYTVKFHDGKEVKLRSSSFDVFGQVGGMGGMEGKGGMRGMKGSGSQLNSALNSGYTSATGSSVPSPVPHHHSQSQLSVNPALPALMNGGQLLLQQQQPLQPQSGGFQQPQSHSQPSSMHALHPSQQQPHSISAAKPPLKAASNPAVKREHPQPQPQPHALNGHSQLPPSNGMSSVVTAAMAHPSHLSSSANPHSTSSSLSTGSHPSSSSSSSSPSLQSSSSSASPHPKMATSVNPMSGMNPMAANAMNAMSAMTAMNPLFSALSSLSSFSPNPSLPFLSPFALQSFFANASPYDAAVMVAALRANGFNLPAFAMGGMPQMAAMQGGGGVGTAAHVTVPHQGMQGMGGGMREGGLSRDGGGSSGLHAAAAAHGGGQSVMGQHASPSMQPPQQLHVQLHQPPPLSSHSLSIHSQPQPSLQLRSAGPSPLSSPLHIHTPDTLPSPRLPLSSPSTLPDLFFSPPPSTSSMSTSFLPSSFLHPFSNPPSALTSPTSSTPIVPFDGIIGDISSPHHHSSLLPLHKRGHDDLLTAPSPAHGLHEMGVGGYEGVELIMGLPSLFTPTAHTAAQHSSFERMLNEQQEGAAKRLKLE